MLSGGLKMRATQQFSRRQWIGVIVLLVLTVVTGVAQTSNTGTVTGVAKDEKGAVIRGATVTVTNLGTNATRTAVTSDDGTYELTQLVAGAYRLEVEAQGFAKFIDEKVTINALSRVTVDPELKPAGAVANVTVTG